LFVVIFDFADVYEHDVDIVVDDTKVYEHDVIAHGDEVAAVLSSC